MIRFTGFLLVGVAVLFSSATVSGNDDWPQWRGPDRTDLSNETGLLQEWPEEGPQRIWLFEDAGIGYSGFSIVGNQLFTMGADDEAEFVLCVDANSGEELWRQSIGKRFKNGWGDGPRSTPTVDGDFVYSLAAEGNLACLNAKDGSVVWEKSMLDLGGEAPSWGYSESVLVDNGNVICTPGGNQGAMVALDAKSGDLKWQSKDFTDSAQYASVVVADHSSKRHYVQLTMKSAVGIDPDNGDVLWKSKWPGSTAVIPTPIFDDDKVYLSSGYRVGSQLLDISELKSVSREWRNQIMTNHHGGVILYEGHLYGYSDGRGWICQDWKTGDMVWNKRDTIRKGAIGYADGRFYLISEKRGNVALIDASPEGWKERGRFQISPKSSQRVASGGIWVHPVICNGKLYLRDQEYIYCYDVKAK